MEHTRKLHTWGGFLLLLVLLVAFFDLESSRGQRPAPRV